MAQLFFPVNHVRMRQEYNMADHCRHCCKRMVNTLHVIMYSASNNSCTRQEVGSAGPEVHIEV